MGKIGILTFHRSVNNGAVLQAYSLSKRLMEEYPDMDIEIIDFHMKKIENAYHYSFFHHVKDSNPYRALKKFVKIILNPGTIYRLNRRTKIFESVRTILPLSKFSIVEDSSKEVFEYINSTYDILVVGSDAVWNYVSRGFPNAYFPDESVKCPKLSYAASCYGMEFIDYSKNDKARIKAILDDFSFIGVRDTATEDFVKWCGSVTMPYHTCDPTAFLNIDNLPIDIDSLVKKLRKRGFDFDRPAIGMMGNEKMCAMIRRIFQKKYQIVALYEYVKNADVNLYDLTPYEWAYVFRYFKLTFTTYFHGTMLSLRHGVPVICIALRTEFAKKHDPKTLDLLKRLGLSEWYFSTDFKQENFQRIKSAAEQLINEEKHDEIIKKMNNEAESFYCFKKRLDEIIYKKAKEKQNG